MAEGIKNLAKDTAIYGVSSIVGRLLNWLLTPMYVRMFTESDNGIITNLYSWVALLFVILTYGMETTFFRYINEKNTTNTNGVYATALSALASTSAIFVALIALFLSPVSTYLEYSNHKDYIMIMAVIIAIDAFCAIPFAYLRYKKRAIKFATLRLFNVGAIIFFNLFFIIACPWIYEKAPALISCFYNPDYGVGYVFVSNLIASSIILLALVPDFSGLKSKADWSLLKKMLKYTYPILILGIAGQANKTIGTILFPMLFDDQQREFADAQLGIYGACLKLAMVIVMFNQAFRFAYEPIVFAKSKGADNKVLYSEAMKYFIIFSLLIFIGVMFYIDIFKLLVTPEYYVGLPVVPLVMMGETFFGIYFNLSLWYKLIDKTEWGAYFSFTGLGITIAILVLFVPVYGFMACAWASLICNLVMMLASYFIGQKKYPIKYDLKSFFIYFSLAMVLYAIGMYLPIENLFLKLAARTGLLFIYIAFMVKRDLPLSQVPIIKKFIK
ncbi:MAG: lipopolysaccharide biosynthesis protein [Tannerellaceae bacterium]